MCKECRKILVVDDDHLIRDSLYELLSILGYNVECAGNGKDAIELMQKNIYDALITDHIMPGINGIELTKKIRNVGLKLLIIGISGTCNEKDFLDAGANVFINKPFTLRVLQNALKSISNS